MTPSKITKKKSKIVVEDDDNAEKLAKQIVQKDNERNKKIYVLFY